jgi:transcriptional regulator with XRE-family HTH domain
MANLVRQSIAKRRTQEDLSSLALAKQIGISSGQLAALESGRDVPSLYTLRKLALFFKWAPGDLGQYVLDSKPEPTGPKRLRTPA